MSYKYTGVTRTGRCSGVLLLQVSKNNIKADEILTYRFGRIRPEIRVRRRPHGERRRHAHGRTSTTHTRTRTHRKYSLVASGIYLVTSNGVVTASSLQPLPGDAESRACAPDDHCDAKKVHGLNAPAPRPPAAGCCGSNGGAPRSGDDGYRPASNATGLTQAGRSVSSAAAGADERTVDPEQIAVCTGPSDG